jgi:hypothetical protein
MVQCGPLGITYFAAVLNVGGAVCGYFTLGTPKIQRQSVRPVRSWTEELAAGISRPQHFQ